MVDALTKFLSELTLQHFPDHELTINSITEPSSLEDIISNATSFKKVELRATFENGHDETQGVLRQLKDSKTKNLSVTASGGKGTMNKLPAFIEELARAAVVVGALTMSYYIPGSTKRQIYDSSESPLSFVARHSHDEDEQTFFARVHTKLLESADKAEAVAHKTIDSKKPASE